MSLVWRLPLVQAPIGPATTPELVAAVSRLGALGTLAGSWTDSQMLRDQVRRVRATVDEPFCVNLVLAFEQRERLDAVLEEQVQVVSFSWGVDPELIRVAHKGGAFVLIQVGEVVDGLAAVDAGADALIVQGVEAGGHVQGRRPLLELLRELRASVRVPLLAAGGIGDAAAAAEALAEGAQGIACGTVFLAAAEANVHPHYLDRLIQAERTDTALTRAFDGGWADAPHRVIRNSTLAAWEAAGGPTDGRRPNEGRIVATRDGVPIVLYDDAQPTRATSGDVEAMAMYAGMSVDRITREEPAAEIAARLATYLA